MILRPHLAYDLQETSVSFVRRLALFHTGYGAERLLEDLRVDRRGFEAGHPDMIEALANIAEIDPDILKYGTIVRLARHREFRGERWSRGFVLPEGARFCSACLVEDGAHESEFAGKGRIVWRLRPVMTCLRHARALDLHPDIDARSELSHRYPVGEELCERAVDQIERTPTALERLIHDRIDGLEANEGTWLKAQTLEQVAEVCEKLGALVEYGPLFDAAGMTATAWRDAGNVGLAIAVKGEDAVRSVLDEVAARVDTSSGKAGPRLMYGRFYEWLAYSTPVVDHGPIRELLRNHILDTLAVEPGEVLLGRKVERRKLHSVHSLSVQTGLHRKRLRKLLVQGGLASEESWDRAAHRLVFPAELAENFCRDLIDAVSLHELPDVLDCTRTQAESLYHCGVLPPVVERDVDRAIHKLSFSRRSIEALLAFVSTLPLEADAEPETVNLTVAAKRTRLSTGELLAKIKAGDIVAFRRPGPVGLANVRIVLTNIDPTHITLGKTVPR